jgi:hypothetical protein
MAPETTGEEAGHLAMRVTGEQRSRVISSRALPFAPPAMDRHP